MSDVITQDKKDIISKLVLNGDLSGLNPEEKVRYYNQFCESLNLNPLTKPFDILNLNGKQILYAKKDATEQLRKINKVSVTDLTSKNIENIYIVTAKGVDKDGRTDAATGAVNIKGLQGDALANAFMKAETKAKRRLTLSICGLGILDEAELETIPGIEERDITPTRTEDETTKVGNEGWKKVEKQEQQPEESTAEQWRAALFDGLKKMLEKGRIDDAEHGEWHKRVFACEDDIKGLQKVYADLKVLHDQRVKDAAILAANTKGETIITDTPQPELY